MKSEEVSLHSPAPFETSDFWRAVAQGQFCQIKAAVHDLLALFLH
jgi:hypothetical protein